MSLIIGVDPGAGKRTGIAVVQNSEFCIIDTMTIVGAMHLCLEIHHSETCGITKLRFEDARQRKWFGQKGRKHLQGAGSIKRDCSIWEEFCKFHEIPYQAVAPQSGTTKWDSDTFRKITGWTERTSEHSRDAAVLVLPNNIPKRSR